MIAARFKLIYESQSSETIENFLTKKSLNILRDFFGAIKVSLLITLSCAAFLTDAFLTCRSFNCVSYAPILLKHGYGDLAFHD
jgi:hypothetical protein